MKENILEFYVNKVKILETTDDINLNFVPSIMRRRMSFLDKVTLSVMNEIFTENVQNIVFSSQYGEVERLLKIIDQYVESKEVSPNVFSGSVHNYPVGFFLLNKQKAIPYNVLSACENSISSGLLASVISVYNNILFCYSDIKNDVPQVIGINFSKKKTNNSVKYRLKIQDNGYIEDSFNDYKKIFSNEINFIKTSNYVLERVEQ